MSQQLQLRHQRRACCVLASACTGRFVVFYIVLVLSEQLLAARLAFAVEWLDPIGTQTLSEATCLRFNVRGDCSVACDREL